MQEVNQDIFNRSGITNETAEDEALLEDDNITDPSDAEEFVIDLRNFLFAYLTPLELLYPTFAECEIGLQDIWLNL